MAVKTNDQIKHINLLKDLGAWSASSDEIVYKAWLAGLSVSEISRYTLFTRARVYRIIRRTNGH